LSTAPGFEEVALPPPVAVGVGLAADADASPRGVIIVEDAEELADTTLWVSASQEDCPIDPDAPPCEVDPSLFPRFEFDAWLNADERVTIRGVDGEAAPTLRVAGIGTHETEARVDLSDAPVGASCLMVSFSDDLRERIERDVAPAGHVFALGVVVERPEPFHCRVGHTLTPVSRVTANWAHGCGPPLITTEPNEGQLRRKVTAGPSFTLVLSPCDMPGLVFLEVDGRLHPLGDLPPARDEEGGFVVDLGELEPGVYQAVHTLINEEALSAAPGRDMLEWWAPTLVSQPVWVVPIER
jgi:hypothetical protein